MSTRRYAVEIWRDRLSVRAAARNGQTLTEGYFVMRSRYATREAAEKQAAYYNLYNPLRPARVVEVCPGRGRAARRAPREVTTR